MDEKVIIESQAKMAIFVPSRNRPQNIEDLIVACHETKFDFRDHKIYVIVDSDDETLDDYREAVWGNATLLVYDREGKGMAKPLNKAVSEYGHLHEMLMFMGDDHRPRTDYWDEKIYQALQDLRTGLVYPNDMLQGRNLATCVAMTSNIAQAMGWAMVPPDMIHLYLDNFWMRLGNDLNSLTYLEDVVVEHLHPIAGKSEWDQVYKEVNDQSVYSADEKAFHNYINGQKYQDLLAVLK